MELGSDMLQVGVELRFRTVPASEIIQSIGRLNRFDSREPSLVVEVPTGSGKTEALLQILDEYSRTFGRSSRSGIDKRERLRNAADELRKARSAHARRAAARAFLAALADSIRELLQFLGRLLILLLSQLEGRLSRADEGLSWRISPRNAFPRITPRGPNTAFPLFLNRGGHQRSALGSAVLAA